MSATKDTATTPNQAPRIDTSQQNKPNPDTAATLDHRPDQHLAEPPCKPSPDDPQAKAPGHQASARDTMEAEAYTHEILHEEAIHALNQTPKPQKL